jgi:2-oxoglutarate ferredoxin oxidoreductase subunit delta
MSKLKIDGALCKGCGLCVEFCPKKALRLSSGVNQRGYRFCEFADEKNCIACASCAVMCPDSIIEVGGNA